MNHDKESMSDKVNEACLEVLFSDRVVKKSVSKEMAFEQKCECDRGISPAKIWGKSDDPTSAKTLKRK